MKKVLITGVGGFIGMHTALRFINAGWAVHGLDNLNDYYSTELKRDRLSKIRSCVSTVPDQFHFYKSDLNSDIWLKLKDAKFDAVIHLAAQAGVRYSLSNPFAYLDSNILGFQRVLEFVSEQKIQKFIYASSSSVYGKTSPSPFSENAPCNNPESYYAATKKANELMAQAYLHTHQTSSIGLRFFTVYGPWGRPDMAPFLFTKAAFEGSVINVYNFGNQQRDFTHISDIVEGIYRCVQNFPRKPVASTYNIGYGKPVQLMEFIRLIEVITGKSIKKKLVPAQLGDVESTYADTSHFQKHFHFLPQQNIEAGLSNFIGWYKEYYKV